MIEPVIKIHQNLNFYFDKAKLSQAISQIEGNSRLEKEINWAYDALFRVGKPQALSGLFSVRKIDAEHVKISGGTQKASQITLHTGIKTDLLEAAELVFVTVTTLGPELDDLRKEEQRKGRTLRSYTLDNAGVLALHAVGKSLNNLAEQQAGKRGWGLGYRMSPGSLAGWSIQDQTALCNLLPIENIGVRLTDSSMLTPLKSVAGMVGMGPSFPSSHVKSGCRWCEHKDTCISRTT